MDKELKQQLEWMNANLNAIVENQVYLYYELKVIKEELQESEDLEE